MLQEQSETDKGAYVLNFQYYVNYVTIVEEGSLTVASRKLQVAQPALSNQIKALEDVYGTRLFHRGSGSRKLELTDTGRILYEKACIMVEAEQAARNEISNAAGRRTGTLRIGVTKAPGSRYLIHLLELFSERYPDAQIMLQENTLPDLIKMLQNGMVEVIFVRSAEEIKEHELEIVFSQKDYLVAAYREGTFFMGNYAESISISELAKFPLCITEDYISTLRTAFRERNCMFTPRFIGPNTHNCIDWALAGKGVAIVPRLSLSMFDHEEMPFKRIDGEPLGSTSLSLITQKRQYRSRMVNSFLEVCAEMGSSKITRFSSESAHSEE